MIGIYKITNKINGKKYVGQSNNINRRFSEHCLRSEIPIDIAIQKYGKENFVFEVLEECSLDELDSKETYWIEKENSFKCGYNCNVGGEQATSGEGNGRSKLSTEDIIVIRKAYNDHKPQKDIYEMFKDRVSFAHFQNIWQGRVWSHVMPEVFTDENKRYYIYENSCGGNSKTSVFSDEEVVLIRTRYIKESAKAIYEDYKDRISFNGFQEILWGRRYKNLPVYSKRKKEWINK